MSYFLKLPKIDQDTALAIIDDVLKQGDTVSVYDGGAVTVKTSTDRAAIIAALCTTDEDRLYFHEAGNPKYYGWAWLVYGNEPGVLVADHTTSERTEAVMARANALMMAYED